MAEPLGTAGLHAVLCTADFAVFYNGELVGSQGIGTRDYPDHAYRGDRILAGSSRNRGIGVLPHRRPAAKRCLAACVDSCPLPSGHDTVISAVNST
jgi:hypothetical protein